MNTTLDEVRERLLLDGLDELAGRVTPADRTGAILARIATRRSKQLPTAVAHSWRARACAAALVLLGVGVLVAVSWFARDAGDTTRHVAAPSLPPVEAPPSEPHPKGTAPADLRAVRSAEAMLAAEERLATALASGRVAGVASRTPFSKFGSWDYRAGLDGMPEEVRALDGTTVVLAGFMLPLDEIEDMREFLLVPSLWSCCYGTPPDIHQIVRCVMSGDATAPYTFEPVMVVGTFTVAATYADGYCVDIYQLHADTVAPIL